MRGQLASARSHHNTVPSLLFPPRCRPLTTHVALLGGRLVVLILVDLKSLFKKKFPHGRQISALSA